MPKPTMAVSTGFEPVAPFRVLWFSKPAESTTLPTHRISLIANKKAANLGGCRFVFPCAYLRIHADPRPGGATR